MAAYDHTVYVHVHEYKGCIIIKMCRGRREAVRRPDQKVGSTTECVRGRLHALVNDWPSLRVIVSRCALSPIVTRHRFSLRAIACRHASSFLAVCYRLSSRLSFINGKNSLVGSFEIRPCLDDTPTRRVDFREVVRVRPLQG